MEPTQVCRSRSVVRYRSTFHTLCEGDPFGEVSDSLLLRPLCHGSDFARRYVLANDLSPTAAEAMRRNVELNGLGPAKAPADAEGANQTGNARNQKGKVVVHEGDAWCAAQ